MSPTLLERGRVLAFQPLPAVLVALDLDTHEAKAHYWKQFERVRGSHVARERQRVATQFRREHAAVSAAVASSAYPEFAVVQAEQLVEQQRHNWGAVLAESYMAVAGDFATRIVGGIKTLDLLVAELGGVEDRWVAIVRAWLNSEAAKKVSGITAQTRKQIRSELAKGVQAGESIYQLSKRLDRLYLTAIIPHRSEVIARTEVIAASNLGARAGAIATGLDLDHEWIATMDGRVRPAHASAGGQTHPMDVAFTVMGQQLMFPGDTSMGATAANTIQCRCTTAYRRHR